MANNSTNFVSPNIRFNEIELSGAAASSPTGTPVAMIGETLKGRAFEPTLVSNFGLQFGSQSTEKFKNGAVKYPLAYAANKFLEESQNLYVCRVLGKSGYTFSNASSVPNAWILTTNMVSGDLQNGYTEVLSGGNYKILAVIRPNYDWVSGVSSDVQTPRVSSVSVVPVAQTALPYVAGQSVSMLSEFKIVLNDDFTNTYTVSFDKSKRSFIGNVLGTKPYQKNAAIFCEFIYPELYQELDAQTISVSLDFKTHDFPILNNYAEAYRASETPYIVSELKGANADTLERLFKFISYGHGEISNRDWKVSIENVNPIDREFDVVVRKYSDTDAKPEILEVYRRCNMRKKSRSYVGRVIGGLFDANGSNLDFDRQSNYVYLLLNENADETSIPCGFEGYEKPLLNDGGSLLQYEYPKYKTEYASGERIDKIYLGLTEKAYDNANGNKGASLNDSFFAYHGANFTNPILNKSKKGYGFHFDIIADGKNFIDVENNIVFGQFYVGAGSLQTGADVQTPSQTYFDVRTRKFTVCPYNGFDGWDIFRAGRTNTAAYAEESGVKYFAGNDYDAWKEAISKFDNPSEIELKFIYTAGINWSDNTDLVQYAIDMIEQKRQIDCFYLVDAPDINTDSLAVDAASLFRQSGIDCNFAGTYLPYMQIQDDQNEGQKIYVSPIIDAVSNFARTENTNFLWFAVASRTRGTLLSALNVRKKLRTEDMDVLYQSGLNGIKFTNDSGAYINHQLTMSVDTDRPLSKINVRLLLNEVKRALRTSCDKFIHEQYDDRLIEEAASTIRSIMDSFVANRGIEQFSINIESRGAEFKDRQEMTVNIAFIPIFALEQITFNLTVDPTGVSFSE